MRRRGRASKPDANQAALVRYARGLGISVLIVAELPSGALDLVVGAFGRDGRVEVKDGSKPPSARKLTEAEQVTFSAWKGARPMIWLDEDDALEWWRYCVDNPLERDRGEA